jgi:thiol-disulfide isomerase/thioredoxin
MAVDESNFGRRVLHAPLPVLALFGAPSCPASRALRPLLGELAASYANQIRFASINAERAGLLASQFGLHMTPTLIVALGGEIVTHAIGFMPPELLRLLCEQIAAGALPPDPLWSPVEATFEDLVIVPLLERWGLTYVRQAASPAPARGRIDFLVYDDPTEPPLTLFENKRHVASAQALAQAVAQAHGYARALGAPSFVVAAPAGLWIYAGAGAHPVLARRISSLELLQRPNDALAILRQMRRS